MIPIEGEFFRPAFEAANPIVVTNSAGVIMYLNCGAEHMFGYLRNELRGKLVEELMPHRFRGGHPQLRQAFNKNPKVRPMGGGRELYGLHKNGSEFYLEVGIHPFVSNHISYILLSIVDITQRKKTHARVEAMFDLAPFALLLVDKAGHITRTNTLAVNLFGYAREELVGKPIETLVPEEFRTGHIEFRNNYMQRPHPREMGEGRNLFALRADGMLIPVEVGLTPYKAEEDSFVLAAVVDLTSRRNALHELELQAQELTLAQQAKAEFLANMSHEFRTPLQSILSFAKFGKTKAHNATAEKLISYFEQIMTSGEQLLELVNQILDLSKLEANRMHYEMKPLPFFEFAAATIEQSKPWGMAKELRFNVNLPLKPTSVSLDSTRIQQVFRNLIANAIKFSHIGSTIGVEGYLTENSVGICVTNTGVKVPAAERQLIFQKFVQSTATKTGAGGTGLGLSLCKKIIADHQGTIWCSETPTGETAFSFELPLHPTEPVE